MENNTENVEIKKEKINENIGKWLGWIGIVVGIIGCLWQPIWLGLAAVVMGVIGLFSPKRNLNIATVIIGAISIIVGLVL